MTFEESYRRFGPDVERISKETGIEPGEVDRRINKAMNERHAVREYSRKLDAALREPSRRPA
jgi:hypothetical protein